MFKRIMKSIIGHIEALFLIMFLWMVAGWNYDTEVEKVFMMTLSRLCISLILLERVLEAIQCAKDVGVKMPWSRRKGDKA